jgi:hypothetical protein
MALLAERLAVPLPKPMRTLPRDPRGYPIPYIVLVDASKQAQFTINDVRKVSVCIKRRLCAICGKRMDVADMWFAGGSRCFLHPLGAFIDPPMHMECGTYAMEVCPFLAARRYTGRIDAAKLDPADLPEGMSLVDVPYMNPRLPALFGFGCARAIGYHRKPDGSGIFVVNDWRYVEWWKAGERVNAPETGEPPPDTEFTT